MIDDVPNILEYIERNKQSLDKFYDLLITDYDLRKKLPDVIRQKYTGNHEGISHKVYTIILLIIFIMFIISIVYVISKVIISKQENNYKEQYNNIMYIGNY